VNKQNIPDDTIIRIEGHSELIRDPKTGAVINMATTEYKRFVEKREKEKSQNKRIQELESTIEDLYNKQELLESMLEGILNKIK